jgi:hypothetical protein
MALRTLKFAQSGDNFKRFLLESSALKYELLFLSEPKKPVFMALSFNNSKSGFKMHILNSYIL